MKLSIRERAILRGALDQSFKRGVDLLKVDSDADITRPERYINKLQGYIKLMKEYKELYNKLGKNK